MPEDPVYLPVQAGRAAGTPLAGFTGDDSGTNISAKNPHYCELTALYWGWKNLDADYLGLVHYRRHFAGKRFGAPRRRIAGGADLEKLLRRAPVGPVDLYVGPACCLPALKVERLFVVQRGKQRVRSRRQRFNEPFLRGGSGHPVLLHIGTVRGLSSCHVERERGAVRDDAVIPVSFIAEREFLRGGAVRTGTTTRVPAKRSVGMECGSTELRIA